MVEYKTPSRTVFVILNTIALVLLCAIFVLPYLIVLSTSVSDEKLIMAQGYAIFPRGFTFYAYKFMFSKNLPILNSLGNSVLMVLASVVLTTLTCTLYAYALQHRKLKGRKFFNLYLVFTMLFSGGLIPTYLVVMFFFEDSLWSCIIPGMMAAYYTFLLRNYFVTVPQSISEAAELDGAGDFRVLFSIYLPLSSPVIATVALFVAVSQWNSYVGPMLYIDSVSQYPIQLTLQKLLNDIDSMINIGSTAIVPTESLKMAAVVVATLPIILVYPFLQKYFINGMIIGGVKE